MNKTSFLQHVAELGVTDSTKVANMIDGGQLGYGPKITALDHGTPLVFPPMTFIVTHLPTMWDSQPKMKHMVKSLIETHAKSITGVDFSYTLNTDGTPIGHDGQELRAPTRTTRSAVDPSMTFQEVTGNLISKIFKKWIFNIQDPDTNSSQIALLKEADTVDPFMFSTFSMSMLGIQFDLTGTPDNIIDAAFYTAMYPTGTGEMGFERTINNTKLIERTIPFVAVVQHNDKVSEFAYRMADILSGHRINFNYATAGASEVDSAIAQSGMQKDLEEMMNEFTEPTEV